MNVTTICRLSKIQSGLANCEWLKGSVDMPMHIISFNKIIDTKYLHRYCGYMYILKTIITMQSSYVMRTNCLCGFNTDLTLSSQPYFRVVVVMFALMTIVD